MPGKREGRVHSRIPFLLIILIAFSGLPISAGVASSPVHQGDTPDLGLPPSEVPARAVGVQQNNSITVQADVLKITSKYEGPLIYSYVTLLVTQVVTGPNTLRGTHIVLRVLGGEVNGTLLWVPDQPCFIIGERVEISVQQQEGNIYLPTSQKKTLARPLAVATTAGYLLYWYKPVVGLTTSTTRPGSDWYGPLKWSSGTFDYWMNPQGIPSGVSTSSFTSYVTASFQAWQDDPNSAIAFTYRGTRTDLSPESRDNVNVVGWMNIGGSTIAETVVGWAEYIPGNFDYLRFTETDMAFDNSKLWSAQPSGVSGRFDVQNIGTHEAGHTFGLGDMYDWPADLEQTMYGEASTGETNKRTLEQGDRAGVATLYPQLSPPAAPILVSPVDGAVGVSLTPALTWQAVSGADAYQVAVYDGASLVLVGYSGSGSYTVPTGKLVSGRTYSWLVWAHNAVGWSNPSAGWSFTTVSVPNAPSLLSPSNGASGVGLTPTLSWGLVSGADAYQIAVYDGASLVLVGYSGSGSYTVPTGKLVSGRTYTWLVWAHNVAGWSNPSTVWSFTTGSIPSAPSLLSPSDGATDVSLTPPLTWAPVSGIDAYQVAVYDGATLVLVGYSGTTSYPVPSARLSYGRTYTWFVWAHNAFGWSNPSAGWSFTTITASPPSSPVLSSPANGAMGVGLTPTLTWSASGFDACQIAIYDGATLVWVGYSGTTSRTVPGAVLVSGRTYTWLVWAHSAVGWSNPSSSWGFTTVTVPNAPSLLSPSNGASGVGLTPTLSWNPVSDADAYQVAVYDGTSLVLVGYSGSGSYTVPSGRLVYGQTYTWLVWAHNGFGWSDPSAAWSFTTGVPSAPVLLSPANGDIGVGLTPTLQWNEDAVGGADAFQIAIYEGSTLIHVGYSASTHYSVPSGILVSGHTYAWVVWAHNGVGWSNPSTIWSFTT